MNRNTERGTTILEYLISAVITGILLVAAVAGIARFTRASAAAREVTELEERRGATADILKSDFDGAGRNLTRPQAPGAGTEQSQFPPLEEYDSGPGTIMKTGATGWTTIARMTRGLGSGIGSFSFTPPASGAAAWVYGADGSSFGLVVGWGGWLGIYEDRNEVAATCCRSPQETIAPHVGGDSYKFSIELREASSPGVVIRLYRTRGSATALLWTASRPLTAYPLGLGADIYEKGETITDISITGAPIINLSGGVTEYSLLPLDRGVRLPSPVTVSEDGRSATILMGDAATDVAYTSAPFSPGESEKGIDDEKLLVSLRIPRRGSFENQDIVEIIDFAAGRACLYRVVDIVGWTGDDGALVLEPVNDSHPAWSRLTADPEDWTYSFPTGSAIVKLAPPVTYSLTSDNRLVRIEGERVTTAGFGVRALTITELTTPIGRSYSIALTLAAEGYETSDAAATETRSTIEYVSVPRALNLTANELN